VSAGFGPGVSVGFLLGHDLYTRWSGEIRYVFQTGEARIRSDGEKAWFSGQAHAIHYDVVWHNRARGERVRLYLAAGAGAKVYAGTGIEAAYRPLMNYAWLTRSRDTKPLLTAASGIKLRLKKPLIVRIEIRSCLTPFPSKVITPANGRTPGWLHDLTPSAGLSWMF
jgi:hypothetical protein